MRDDETLESMGADSAMVMEKVLVQVKQRWAEEDKTMDRIPRFAYAGIWITTMAVYPLLEQTLKGLAAEEQGLRPKREGRGKFLARHNHAMHEVWTKQLGPDSRRVLSEHWDEFIHLWRLEAIPETVTPEKFLRAISSDQGYIRWRYALIEEVDRIPRIQIEGMVQIAESAIAVHLQRLFPRPGRRVAARLPGEEGTGGNGCLRSGPHAIRRRGLAKTARAVPRSWRRRQEATPISQRRCCGEANADWHRYPESVEAGKRLRRWRA